MLLSLLAVLIICLWISVELRLRADEAGGRAREEPASGRPLDVSAIAPQIARLRRNYTAAAHSRPHPGPYQRGLLASTRRGVANLSFFHRATAEEDLQEETRADVGR